MYRECKKKQNKSVIPFLRRFISYVVTTVNSRPNKQNKSKKNREMKTGWNYATVLIVNKELFGLFDIILTETTY